MVVDDEPRNRDLLEAMLVPEGYQVDLVASGPEALAQIFDVLPDVVLLDVMMPDMDGYEVAGRLKADVVTRDIPVVMVTALHAVEDRVRALEAGADDFLTKPVQSVELRARVRSLLKVKAYHDQKRRYQEQLEAAVRDRTRRLQEALARVGEASLETTLRLSRAAEFRDDDTGAHVVRMSRYVAEIARHMGLSEERVRLLVNAAPMHDVGKIGIPDSILLKPGRLTDDELAIMRQHPVYGGRILEGSRAPVIQLAETVALTHHERWDGAGYPSGLSGEAIPVEGRIVAVADVFDALTSQRPYKPAFSVERASVIIREGAGSQFDPEIVVAFFAVLDRILEIRERYSGVEDDNLYDF